MKSKISALIFTYKGDQKLIATCIAHILKTLGAGTWIVVADDGFNPLPETTVNEIKTLGVDYRQTMWVRNGNLIGEHHLEGATRLMAEMAKQMPDDGVIVKVDTDACLLKRDWLDELSVSSMAKLAGSYKNRIWYPMGNCYAVRSDICQRLYDDAILFTAWDKAYEDYEIGVRIGRLCDGKIESAIRWNSGKIVEGFFLTDAGDIDYPTVIKYGRVYSGGFFTPPPDRRDEWKEKQLKVMQGLLYYREHPEKLDEITQNPNYRSWTGERPPCKCQPQTQCKDEK